MDLGLTALMFVPMVLSFMVQLGILAVRVSWLIVKTVWFIFLEICKLSWKLLKAVGRGIRACWRFCRARWSKRNGSSSELPESVETTMATDDFINAFDIVPTVDAK